MGLVAWVRGGMAFRLALANVSTRCYGLGYMLRGRPRGLLALGLGGAGVCRDARSGLRFKFRWGGFPRGTRSFSRSVIYPQFEQMR